MIGISGQGFISTSILKQILHEIDENLSDADLDGIIEEVDEDGSGTVDFDGKLACYERMEHLFGTEVLNLFIFFRVYGNDDWLNLLASRTPTLLELCHFISSSFTGLIVYLNSNKFLSFSSDLFETFKKDNKAKATIRVKTIKLTFRYDRQP